MKKQGLLFITVLILGIVTVYFLNGGNDYRPDDDSQFKVERVKDIKKVFLANSDGSSRIIEMIDGEWKVDGQYVARPDAVEYLLETVKRIEMNYPVPRSHTEKIVKRIASDHTKVELYDANNNIIRSYFVGGPTEDYEGTYLFMENGERPYVCHIPGFNGYLTTRFVTQLKAWRDKTVIAHKPRDIQSVSVTYKEDKPLMQSFKLDVISPDSFVVTRTKTGEVMGKANKPSLRQYLTFFEDLSVEGFENDFPKKDSILSEPQFCDIMITLNNGEKNHITTYLMDLTQRSKVRFDKQGKDLRYDLDRLFVTVNEHNDFAIIQMHTFGKLFQSYHAFKDEKSMN